MRKYAPFFLLIFSMVFTSCYEDRDDVAVTASQINDFVWKGMNLFYLYKDEIPDLSNNRFSSNGEYASYLNNYALPEDLFESLIYERQTVDRFSWIVDDYFALEQLFQGTSGTTGMEANYYFAPNSSTEIFGVVRLVLPNSEADQNNVKRGDIFYAIDGITLTEYNLSNLVRQENFTLNLGFYNDKGTTDTTDDAIDPLDQNINLTRALYTEDPIFKTEIFNVGGENVGYLMYNGFIAGSENELNTIFNDFKSNNIQHLVLDLRYNPGGSVSTETYLASMITGQFTNQVFTKLVFNSNFQDSNTDYTFVNSLSNGTSINSLGLEKLYVLTSKSSASASEGLINGLSPYIEVVQIGNNTTGKTQASRTLYDSPNFTKEGINPSHTYAMQPLIANGLNKNDVAVPGTGLSPTLGFDYIEHPLNHGVLGDINEPLLAIALADIESLIAKIEIIKTKSRKFIKSSFDSNTFNPLEGGMQIE